MKAKAIRNTILNILYVVICGVIAYCLATYLFTTIPVEGGSMESTIHDDDKVLLLKPVKNFRHGDIVVFKSGTFGGDGNERYFIKRIIGLPGDTVEIIKDPEDGVFYVWRNGEKLVEEYIGSAMKAEMPRVVVPEGQFFYMGDNRGNSTDSRALGCRSFESILGRVLLRYSGGLADLDIEIVHRLLIGEEG